MELHHQNPEHGNPAVGFGETVGHMLVDKDIVSAPASPEYQDPFGDERNVAVKYRTMAWWQTGMIMIAETISLGILALPKALATLGLFPGILTILVIGIISTYTGYTIGQLKQRYMHIHSMADVGELLMGPHGRRILGFGQQVFLVFVMASHVLTFSIMMNVLADHHDCTILYAAIGVFISFLLTIPRRLEKLSHLSSASFISIFGAVLTTMVGVSLAKINVERLSFLAPAPTVHDTCLAVANIVFAYAGHVAFFTLFSELRDIKDFPKALALLQMCEMILYTTVAIVIYVYAGAEATSPALNSAGKHFRQISYGIAIPTILIGGVVNAHVAVKYFYVRLFRGTNAMHTQSFTARGTWVAMSAALWIIAGIIAEGIPVFNDVLGLASSLFASWFSFGLPGLFWLHMNRDRWFLNWRQRVMFSINLFLAVLAIFICVVGLYSSVRSIFQNLRTGVGGGSFSCADNSL